MARTRTVYVCSSCDAQEPKWSGRCGTCGEWNSLHEQLNSAPTALRPLAAEPSITSIGDVEAISAAGQSTGMSEVDRVLGGGLIRGSVTLLGGEPGVGKSTLVLQLLANEAESGRTCLYVTGEESPQQVKLRADRLGLTHPKILVAAEVSVPSIVAAIEEINPALCVIDSVQTLEDPEVESGPGSVSQVRAAVNRLVSEAKERSVTMVLVGHVTKDGNLAGPRVLEHAVDTVLSLEGERDQGLRVLRASKHRFGSTSEIGLMTLGEKGLAGVEDASGIFLGDRLPLTPGSVVSATTEGHRPLALEVQALVVPTVLPQPKRSAKGFDPGRLGLLLAVMEQRCNVRMTKFDVYVNIAGGIKVTEPGIDLALCLALASALTGWPVPEGWFACGEVGLGGEIRGVSRLEQRLGEATRLGFDSAVIPRSGPSEYPGMEIHRVSSLSEALEELMLDKRSN